jgi:hypothetical protein
MKIKKNLTKKMMIRKKKRNDFGINGIEKL